MPSTPKLVAIISTAAALLAWIESRRMRRVQDRDFDFQRAADVRLDRFTYFARVDLAHTTEPRQDELRFRVKNVGRAFASEMNFAVDDRGMLHYVQMGLGMPPGLEKELILELPKGYGLNEREIVFRYRYDDFRRHWGEVRLLVPNRPNERTDQFLPPRILSARLDGKKDAALTEGSLWQTPMTLPRWYDPLLNPYQRWRFKRDHPEIVGMRKKR